MNSQINIHIILVVKKVYIDMFLHLFSFLSLGVPCFFYFRFSFSFCIYFLNIHFKKKYPVSIRYYKFQLET